MNKVTIKDVSRLAGVSIATVSYVLNNTPGKSISDETARKVRDAAESLCYVSSNAAKSLQSGMIRCVGVVIDQLLAMPRYSYLLQGIMDTLSAMNINVLLCSNKSREEGGYPDYINAYLSRTVDAIIYVGADGSKIPSEIEATIVERSIPLVACDSEASRLISTVDVDYLDGAYRTAKYLIETLGVKRLIFVRPSNEVRQETERELGLRKAVRESSGVRFDMVSEDRKTLMMGIYLENGPVGSPLATADADTAFVGSWSAMDMPLLYQARRLGLNIPVATLAHGNLDRRFIPNVYYCIYPSYEMGTRCAELIMEQLKGESKEPVHELIRCIVPGENKACAENAGDRYFITPTPEHI